MILEGLTRGNGLIARCVCIAMSCQKKYIIRTYACTYAVIRSLFLACSKRMHPGTYVQLCVRVTVVIIIIIT